MKYQVTLIDGKKYIVDTQLDYTQDEVSTPIVSMIAIEEESSEVEQSEVIEVEGCE